MTRQQREQKRALTPDLVIRPPEDRYRAALNLELQKFPDREKQKKFRQLRLLEALPEAQDQAGEIEIFGLESLDVSQIRALSAVQILLDRTDYKGNEPGAQAQSNAFQWEGLIPKLRVTYPEFLEAYGLERNKKGRFNMREREEALKALESLTIPFRIGYERKYYEGAGKKRKQKSDIVITDRALIGLTRGYRGLDTEKEAPQVKAGSSNKRVTHLIIEPYPSLLDQIDSFFVLKPVQLYREIADLLATKQKRARVSKTHITFIEWLLTVNLPEINIGFERLAEKLNLYYLIDTRQRKRLQSEIQKTIDIAMELGYLLDWREEFGTYCFIINPDRAGRTLKDKKLKELASSQTEEAK